MAAEANPLFARGRQRAFIKVQDGCRYRCAFCIVTLARGEEHSRPIHEVVDEINRAATAGVREAVLAGVHLGGWGSDLGLGLDDLIGTGLDETDLPLLAADEDSSGRMLMPFPGEASLGEMEKATILKTLEAAEGNKSEAARRLGITRRTLHQKLKKWGMM